MLNIILTATIISNKTSMFLLITLIVYFLHLGPFGAIQPNQKLDFYAKYLVCDNVFDVLCLSDLSYIINKITILKVRHNVN